MSDYKLTDQAENFVYNGKKDHVKKLIQRKIQQNGNNYSPHNQEPKQNVFNETS